MAYLTGPKNQLADFQVEYAGLLMGPGTAYDVPPTWQFLDMGPVRTMEAARPWGDGSWAGPDFADVATWQMPVELVAAPPVTFPQAVLALLQVFTIARTARPLWFKLPGLDVRGIPARCAQRSIPIDLGWGQYSLGAVQWRAPNPIWQSLPRTVVLTPGSGGGGLSSPLFTTPPGGATPVLDFGIATAAASAATVTNAGSADASPVIVVTGPTAGFQVTVDGHIVAYSDTLGPGDTVTVDYATGRAALSSYGAPPVDRTYLLTARDFAAVPAAGRSVVTFAGTGGTAAVTTADLWR